MSLSVVPMTSCVVCSETTSQTELKTHISIHVGYNPYKCKVCQASFPDIDFLQDHAIEAGHLPLQMAKEEDDKLRNLVHSLMVYSCAPADELSARTLVNAANGIIADAHDRFVGSFKIASLVSKLFGDSGTVAADPNLIPLAPTASGVDLDATLPSRTSSASPAQGSVAESTESSVIQFSYGQSTSSLSVPSGVDRWRESAQHSIISSNVSQTAKAELQKGCSALPGPEAFPEPPQLEPLYPSTSATPPARLSSNYFGSTRDAGDTVTNNLAATQSEPSSCAASLETCSTLLSSPPATLDSRKYSKRSKSGDLNTEPGLIISEVKSLFDELKTPPFSSVSETRSPRTLPVSKTQSSPVPITSDFRSLFDELCKTASTRIANSVSSSVRTSSSTSPGRMSNFTIPAILESHGSSTSTSGSRDGHLTPGSATNRSSPQKDPTPDSGVHEFEQDAASCSPFSDAGAQDFSYATPRGEEQTEPEALPCPSKAMDTSIAATGKGDEREHKNSAESGALTASTSENSTEHIRVITSPDPDTTSDPNFAVSADNSPNSCVDELRGPNAKADFANNSPERLTCRSCSSEIDNAVIMLVEHAFMCVMTKRRTVTYLFSCKLCRYQCSNHRQIAQHVAKHIIFDGEPLDERHFDVWIESPMHYAIFKQDFKRCFDEGFISLIGVIDLSAEILEYVSEFEEKSGSCSRNKEARCSSRLRSLRRVSADSTSSGVSQSVHSYSLRTSVTSGSCSPCCAVREDLHESAGEEFSDEENGMDLETKPFEIVLERLPNEIVERAVQFWAEHNDTTVEENSDIQVFVPASDSSAPSSENSSERDVDSPAFFDPGPSSSGIRAPKAIPPCSYPRSASDLKPTRRKRKPASPSPSTCKGSPAKCESNSGLVVCQLCSTRFALADERAHMSHVLQHVQKDTQVRLYACRICVYQTNKPKAMVAHILQHCVEDEESPEVQHYTVRWDEVSRKIGQLWRRAFPTIDELDVRRVQPTFIVDVHALVQESYIQRNFRG